MLEPSITSPVTKYHVEGFLQADRRASVMLGVWCAVMRVARPELRDGIPPGVRRVLGALHARGGRAWLVGGTVRDLLLDRTPDDFDIATDLRPEAVERALPGSDPRDARFGTVHVDSVDAGRITVTTLRAEGGYADRRHPDAVTFVTDVAADARRRDFTVNALYFDDLSGEVLDEVGGLSDLEKRTLRAIGDPGTRFGEDALRLLRLVKFAARLGFSVEPGTAGGAAGCAGMLGHLAPERAWRELTEIFTREGRGAGLRLLVELGLAGVLLPEVAAMEGVEQPPQYHPEGDVLTHTALVLDALEPDDPVLSWAAVLHDVGKPSTFERAADRIRFHGHDVVSARMARAVLLRFRASRAMTEVVVEICRDHIRFAALPRMRPKRREAWMRQENFTRHLAFHRADCLGSHGNLEVYEFARRALASLPPAREHLLRGRDVIALGVSPGPEVGELLARALAAIDDAPMPLDRAEALDLLRDMVSARNQDPERRTR